MSLQLLFILQGEYYYNIYNYDELRPSIWTYDISNCFDYTKRRDFSLKLPGKCKTEFRPVNSGKALGYFRQRISVVKLPLGLSNNVINWKYFILLLQLCPFYIILCT